VKLSIYDGAGREVTMLVNEERGAGHYRSSGMEPMPKDDGSPAELISLGFRRRRASRPSR